MNLKFVHFLIVSIFIFIVASYSLFFLPYYGECEFIQSISADLKKRQTKNVSYVKGCYFTNWSQYRRNEAKYLPENYVPGLCTHIFYAFVYMNDDFTLKPSEWNDDIVGGLYERIVLLKKKQNGLKVILSFGGATFSKKKKLLIKSMVSKAENRKTFIQSALDYVRKHNFDGLDLDWEVPEASDKESFSNLLKEMSAVFRKNSLLISAAVASYQKQIDESYDVPVLAQTLDTVNIMTYDYHGSGWANATGFNSPLYDSNGDKLSMSSSVEYYVSKGLPKNKINVGFATYGRSWTLSEPKMNTVGSPGTAGPEGLYTKQAGLLAYYEICDLPYKGAKIFFNQTQKMPPYLVTNSTWVGYDDEESFKVKLDWLINGGYGGAFIWALDFDDFNGRCPDGRGQKYPLLNTIATHLKNVPSTEKPKIVATVVSIPGSGPATKSTMEAVGESFVCLDSGLFPDPTDCSKFYSCGSAMDAHRMDCPQNLHFNKNYKICDWPKNAKCQA